MKTSNMKKLLTLLVYCCGFPALLIYSIIVSVSWYNTGMYGVGAFAPLFIVLAIYLIVGMIKVAYTIYYRKKVNPVLDNWKVAMVGCISSLILIFGIFIAIECVMPSILYNQTSGSILYETVTEDAIGQHKKFVEQIEEFKTKNNLDKDVKVTDEAFKKKFYPIFHSMEKAYNSYDKLAIGIATRYPDFFEAIKTGKMPISVAATLLVKTDPNIYVNNHNLTADQIIALNKAEVIKAINVLLKNLDNVTDSKTINEILNEVLLTKKFNGIEWNIFNILGNNPFVPEVDVNADIVKNIEAKDGTTQKLSLGASLSYQNMAWINGLDQMFFIPLLAFRNIMFIFSVAIVVSSLMVGAIKNSYVASYGEQICVYKEMKRLTKK